MVGLGIAETVSDHGFGEGAGNIVGTILAIGEGFPDEEVLAFGDTDDGFGAREFGINENTIISLVREKGLVRILPSCGNGTGRGSVEPKVVVRSEGQEEGLHGIYILDGVVLYPVDGFVRAGGLYSNCIGGNEMSFRSCVKEAGERS